MSNKNSKFKSNTKKRVVHHVRFNRYGHLINTMLKPENKSKVEDNLNNAISFTTPEVFEEVQEFIFKDDEVMEAFGNTIIIDNAGNEVNDEVKKEARREIVHKATEDAINDVIVNKGNAYTKEAFFKLVKNNTLDRLEFLRNNAQKDNEKTQENTSKSLLGRFAKKVKVYARSILSMFENDKKNTQAIEKQIEDNSSSVKTKVLYNKVSQRVLRVAAAAGFSAILLTACTSDSNKKTDEKKVDAVEQTAETPAPIQETAPQQTVEQDSVVVQTEYSDSLQVSRSAWDRTKNVFFGDKYELANKRLTNKIMKENFDGRTREYVLNQLAYNVSFYTEKKISEWETALNNGLEDENTKKIVQAYRASQQVICYLTDVNVKEFPKEAKDIFINQEMGDLDKNVKSVTFRDCDNIDVKYKNTISWKQATALVQDTISADTLSADTVTTQKDFVLGGGSAELENKVEQPTSNVDANVSKNKSNREFEQDKKTGDGDIADIDGRKPKDDPEFMLEVKEGDANNDVATRNKANSLEGASEVVGSATNEEAAQQEVTDDAEVMLQADKAKATQQAAAETAGADGQNGFTELSDNAKAKEAAPEADVETADADGQNGFTDLSDNAKAKETAPKAEVKTADDNNQEGFTELSDNAKAKETAPKADVVAPAKDIAAAQADSVETQIFEGTEGVELGTPALGTVTPRGGYNHTDVSLENIEFAEDVLGKEVCDNIRVNYDAHPEWSARGGFAEGLTADELIVILAVRTKVFPYAKTTSDFRKAVICEETLAAEKAEKVKDAINKVNQNYTIDGVVYNKKTNTLNVKFNGCDQKPTVNIAKTNDNSVTYPKGPKFPRFFQKIIARVQTAFGIGGGSVDYETAPQDTVKQEADLYYAKSNQQGKNAKTLRQATANEFNRDVKDRIVWIESDRENNDGATYNMSNAKFAQNRAVSGTSNKKASQRTPRKNSKVYLSNEEIAAYQQRNARIPD